MNLNIKENERVSYIQKFIKNHLEKVFKRNLESFSIRSGSIFEMKKRRYAIEDVCKAMTNLQSLYDGEWISGLNKRNTETLVIKYFNPHFDINKKMKQVDKAENEIIIRLDNAFSQGEQELDIVAKDIHKEIGLSNNYPAVCSAMDKVTELYKFTLIHNTNSGKSSTNHYRFINSFK